VSEPPFVFTSLGRIDLQHSSRGSVSTLLAQPKRLALLAYLLVAHPGGHASRDVLLAMFWPDSDEQRARAALRQALQFLRRTLGDDAVVSQGDDSVGISPAVVRHDLAELRTALTRGDASAVVATYGGDLLPGLLVDDAPAFEHWLSGEREQLRQRVVQQAIRASSEAASPMAAVEMAARAVLLAPGDEVASRRLAEAHARAGNRAAALRELDRLRHTLQETLGVTPSAETQALEQSLRDGPTVPPSSVINTADVSADTQRTSPSPTEVAPSPTVAASSASSPRSRRSVTALVALTVSVAVLWLGFSVARRNTNTLSPTAASTSQSRSVVKTPRIAVAPFDDRTGQSQLSSVGSMVADWLIGGVSRMDGVTVVPLTALRAASRALESEPAPSSGLAPDLLQRAAIDAGATMLVRGVVYYADSTLHLQAQLTRMPSGELLRAAETVSVPAYQIMQGLEQLQRRVVAALAPVGDTVSHLRHAAAPPSYEAYRDYVRGLEQFVQGSTDEALRLFRQATRDDSSYPMPRIAASIALLNLGRADEAAAQVAGLDAHRADLPPLERATFDMLRGMLDGNLAAVDRAVREQARIAPGTIGEYMVAETARRLGNPAEALRVLRALGPDRGELRGWRPYWRELTGALHMLGDYDGERRAADEAITRYGPEPIFMGYALRALAAQGDSAAVLDILERRERLSTTTPPDAGTLWHMAANEAEARCARTSASATCMTDPRAPTWWRDQERRWFEAKTGSQRGSGVRWRHARALALSGQWQAARDTLLRVGATGTDDVSHTGLLGVIAAATGDATGEAQAAARLSLIQQRRSPAARSLAEGDVDYWLAAMAAQHPGSPVHTDSAMQALQRAVGGWRGHDVTLTSDPLLAPLRAHPGFVRLVAYTR